MKNWFLVTLLLAAALVGSGIWISASLSEDLIAAPSLRSQWVVVAGILVLMCAWAGWIVNGRVDGIFIDERHRISLSRVQWVVWFVILISAFFVATLLNVHSGQANPFPLMQTELFGLIGLASGSAVVSNLIVDAKKKSAPAAPAVVAAQGAPLAPQNHVGNIDVNATATEASWKDVYCGEEVANRDIVDVSRLQQLVTTLLLAMVYIGFLWRDLDSAAFTGEMLKMPEVSDGFLGLLGVSHAGYLAYKATPKI